MPATQALTGVNLAIFCAAVEDLERVILACQKGGPIAADLPPEDVTELNRTVKRCRNLLAGYLPADVPKPLPPCHCGRPASHRTSPDAGRSWQFLCEEHAGELPAV